MGHSRLGMRAKSLLALLALSLVSFAVIASVAIYYMGQISEFARLSNVSLGNTAADKSSSVLVKQSEEMIHLKARDVAKHVEMFLVSQPDLNRQNIEGNSDFKTVAVQKIGDTGYTYIYEKKTGIMKGHPDPELISLDMHNYQTKFPAWWKIFSAGLDGSASSGYCEWEEVDGNISYIFMSIVPVEGTDYVVAATMSENEFQVQSKGIREEINAAALSSSEYIAQQTADMYRVFSGVIIGLLVIVAGLAFWLARMITRPIRAVADGSKIIANGNFDHRVEVKSGDEIEQLAEQFNTMAATLKESYANLEQKVEKRTGELREANMLLKKEILQREQAQDALRRSEVKYRHLVEKANCIILEMDIEGKVIFFNKFGLDFFGYSEVEIVGHGVVGTIVPSIDAAGRDLAKMIQDITLHPERYAYNENENIRRDGEKVWVVWLNQPIYDKENRLSGVLCVGMDRTQLKQAEELT